MTVYVLIHEFAYEETDEILGVYSTRENAEQAMTDARDPDKVAAPVADGESLNICEWYVDAVPWQGG